jgi:ketosteroid isomerase-like protein
VNGRLPLTTTAAFAMIACAAAAFSRTDKAHAATDSATIARLEQRWVAAVSPGGDRRTLDDILAHDYMDTDWQGRTRDKADLLKAAAAKDVAEHVTGMQVRVWGDTAVTTGINHMHSSTKGWSVDIAFTDVFSRINGHWRAVSSQETLRKPAQSSH